MRREDEVYALLRYLARKYKIEVVTVQRRFPGLSWPEWLEKPKILFIDYLSLFPRERSKNGD